MSDLSREQTAADNLVWALREALEAKLSAELAEYPDHAARHRSDYRDALAKVAEAFSAMMRAAE